MENKTAFAKFIDNCFYCIVIIFLSSLWSGYFLNKISHQLIFGILFGSISYFFIFKLFKKLSEPKLLKRTEEKHMRDCILALSIADPNKVYTFFEIMLKKDYQTTKEFPFIKAQRKDSDERFLIYFNFLVKAFSLENFYETITKSKKYELPILIFAPSFSDSCIKVSNAFSKVKLLNSTECYLFFKKFNTFPKITDKVKEKMFTNLKNNIFSSNYSKKYLKASLILVVLSIFTKLKTYYLIIASLLFIFALISRLKKSNTSAETNNMSLEVLNN